MTYTENDLTKEEKKVLKIVRKIIGNYSTHNKKINKTWIMKGVL
jgi:hypothetical protein